MPLDVGFRSNKKNNVLEEGRNHSRSVKVTVLLCCPERVVSVLDQTPKFVTLNRVHVYIFVSDIIFKPKILFKRYKRS